MLPLVETGLRRAFWEPERAGAWILGLGKCGMARRVVLVGSARYAYVHTPASRGQSVLIDACAYSSTCVRTSFESLHDECAPMLSAPSCVEWACGR